MNKISKIDITPVIRNLPIILFVVVALVAGSIFIKNRGSFSGPDLYGAHYRASLAAATGQMFSEPVTKGTRQISYITGNEKYFESGQKCVQNKLVSSALISPLGSDYGRGCIRGHDKTLSSDKNVTVPVILQYPAIGYIPQATGLGVGMAANLEPITAQTLARYLNLFTYIVLVVASIVLIPRGKWLIALLGVLPTSLYLASSLSADAMNIAWNMLFVAYVLRLYMQRERMTRWQVATVAVLGFGLFMLKVAYVPLLLLVLALGKEVISNRSKWLLFASVLLSGTFAYMVWSAKWGSMNASVDVANNFSAIIHNLDSTIVSVIVNVLYTPLRLFDIHESTIYLCAAILVGALVLTHLRTTKQTPIKTLGGFIRRYQTQLLALLAAVASLGLTYAALLLTWTDVSVYGFMNIQGFQGRYVLPLLPLLLVFYFIPQKNSKKT